jgi:hypothetical protein
LSLEVIQWSTRTLKRTGAIDINWRSRMWTSWTHCLCCSTSNRSIPAHHSEP